MSDLLVTRGAVLIPPHRYLLTRDFHRSGRSAAIIAVNPSQAGAEADDPSSTKIDGFCARNDIARYALANKFAFQAKDVRELRRAADPVGPQNDAWIERAIAEADVLIVAWGTLNKLPVRLRQRWRDVVATADRLGRPMLCLGTAGDGHPPSPAHGALCGPAAPMAAAVMSDWGKVPREVFMDQRLTRGDIRVLGILCAYANGKTGICTRRQEAIAEEIGSSRESVNRSLKKLVTLGYVQTKARAGMKRSLEYRVLVSDQSNGQLALFDAHEAPRSAKPKTAKRDGKITSVVTLEVTSVVTSDVTAIEQTPVNSTEPVGSSAQPRGREAANDHRLTASMPSVAKKRDRAIPLRPCDVDAVPFLAPEFPPSAQRLASMDLENRLRDAAGSAISPISPTLSDLSAVFRWIGEGCDLERDILPAISGRSRSHRGQPIRTWGYFEGPVVDAHRKRLALQGTITSPDMTIVPFDPNGVRHEQHREDQPSRPGRFAAIAEQRRREFARLKAGGSPDED